MKKYSLTIIEADNGNLSIEGEAEGYNAFEVLGLLEFKLEDIKKQIRGEITPDKMTRTVIKMS